MFHINDFMRIRETEFQKNKSDMDKELEVSNYLEKKLE